MTDDDKVERADEGEKLDPAALEKVESTSGKGAPTRILLCTKGVSLKKLVEMSK